MPGDLWHLFRKEKCRIDFSTLNILEEEPESMSHHEDLSQARRAIKEDYGPIMDNAGAAQLDLCTNGNQLISTWRDLNSLSQEYFIEGCSFVVVGVLPLPARQSQIPLSTEESTANTSKKGIVFLITL